MKKLVTMLITASLVFTMAVPTFAAESAAPTAKPAKVQELKVEKNGYKSLKLSWKPVEGATSYQVYRSKTGKSGSFALKKTTTSTKYSNTGITCGKTYYYKVRAVNKAGKGAFSAVKSNKVQPGKVTITKVTCPRENCVRIHWNKVDGATGYQIYKRKKGSTSWSNCNYTNDKFSWSYSKKYNYATHMLTTFVASGDSAYTKWEYKVRAYRTVNGKKVYGYFSTPKEYVPDWTIDEIYEELWKYGESLAWTEYEWKEGIENPETGDELWPTNRKYYFKHCKGSYTLDNGENWHGIFTNPENGETEVPQGAVYEPDTPENSSWDVLWPERISYYNTKALILKELKPMIKNELYSLHYSNPLYWDPYLEIIDGQIGAYNGSENFSIYIKKDRNSYKIWSLW
ncbi:MAG: fibronectin type III domain-containing protein [Emergencia sp.]|nr:fibronectin type III domain-containing protein [Emergencia sp.]